MIAIKTEKANKHAKTDVAIIKAFFWEHTATPFLSYKLRLLLLWLSPPAIISAWGCVLVYNNTTLRYGFMSSANAC